jgi:hypothetical protein
MGKRHFRCSKHPPTDDRPDYPTTEVFDAGRRDFLAKLGGVILGAGTLAACGHRPAPAKPDVGHTAGVAPAPDAGVDSTGGPDPDQSIGPFGLAPAPDAHIDKHDDAKVDVQPSPGFAPPMDAAVDDDGGRPTP